MKRTSILFTLESLQENLYQCLASSYFDKKDIILMTIKDKSTLIGVWCNYISYKFLEDNPDIDDVLFLDPDTKEKIWLASRDDDL